MPGWPVILREDSTLRVGEAEIRFKGDALSLKDPYTDRTLSVKVKEVEVRPYPPVYVPKKVTDYLLLEFDPFLPEDGNEVWLTAPYDLAIRVKGRVMAFLSPFRVKYTLYGPTTEGLICRYHRAEVMESPGEGDYAYVKVRFIVNKHKEVSKLVMPVSELDIYTDGTRTYYELVEASLGDLIGVELKNNPPLEAIRVYPPGKMVKVIDRIMSKYKMRW